MKIDKFEKFKKINETGEWDESEGKEWKKALKKILKEVKEYINDDVEFTILNIKGFDMYQGPYANIKINDSNFTVWMCEYEDNIWIEDFPIDNMSDENTVEGFMGSAGDVADVINKIFSNE